MHLPVELLTLISGHRRGVRQLHTIELGPPIPLLHSSPHLSAPTSKKCATASRDRTSPPLRIFLCHDSDLTLEVCAGSCQENRARGIEIFAASRSQNRITDTAVVSQCRNLTPSRAAEPARRTCHQNTVSWATAMWMLSSSEPRSIPLSETYMMSVWACIAPLFVMRFAPLRQ